MSGVIDALFLDEFRQPPLGLRLCDLIGAINTVRLALFIWPGTSTRYRPMYLVPTTQTEPLCPDLRDMDLLSR